MATGDDLHPNCWLPSNNFPTGHYDRWMTTAPFLTKDKSQMGTGLLFFYVEERKFPGHFTQGICFLQPDTARFCFIAGLILRANTDLRLHFITAIKETLCLCLCQLCYWKIPRIEELLNLCASLPGARGKLDEWDVKLWQKADICVNGYRNGQTLKVPYYAKVTRVF